MTSDTNPSFPLLPIILCVLALVVGLVLWFGVPGPAAPGTAGAPAAAKGINYGIELVSAKRTPEGRYAVQIEFCQEDAWHWEAFSLQGITVIGTSRTKAELVSPLPSDPIPDCFKLEFLSDAVDQNAGELHLALEINIKAKRHLGLSGASSHKTQSVAFPASDAEQGREMPEERERGMTLIGGDLSVAVNGFYALGRAARNALRDGKVKEAEALATELARLAPKYKHDWNYGNAIEDANQVLGRIALSRGDVGEAKKRLLASADSQGSPQLNSFGPNFVLARELAERGERETAIAFLDAVARFWANPAAQTAASTSSNSSSGKNNSVQEKSQTTQSGGR